MKLTPKMVAEIASHEAIVREAYKDSVGVWTWGIGVTDESGHKVKRYRDNPQTHERVFEVFVWLLENKYLPDVLKAFRNRSLTETQLAAALSFHYNTGGIRRASWVKKWLAGDMKGARRSFMSWKKPASIIPRRKKERDLFFDGKWTNDGTVMEWPVKKPRYTPDWGKGKRVYVMDAIKRAMGIPRLPSPAPPPQAAPLKPQPGAGPGERFRQWFRRAFPWLFRG